MSFDLASLVSTKNIFSPQRILLYGVQGIGKTTFGASFKSPILLRTEDGIGSLDIATFPNVAKTTQDIANAISALHGDHNFKTLILDSLDWLEPLVLSQVVANHNMGKEEKNYISSIEDIGYGKGYVMADDLWRYIMGGFDSLRQKKGMNIVVIAHNEVKTFNPPDGESFDRYQIRLQKRSFALWQEWADMVLFVNYERNIVKDETGTKKRALGNGERVIYTQERPAFMAKNRWSLPEEIFIGKDKTWSNFHNELEIATNNKYSNPQKETIC